MTYAKRWRPGREDREEAIDPRRDATVEQHSKWHSGGNAQATIPAPYLFVAFFITKEL